jgi:hypothetical protein
MRSTGATARAFLCYTLFQSSLGDSLPCSSPYPFSFISPFSSLSLHHSLRKAARPPSDPHDAGEFDHVSYLGRATFRRGSMMTKEVLRASEQALPRRPWVQPARLHMLCTDTRFGDAREASSSKWVDDQARAPCFAFRWRWFLVVDLMCVSYLIGVAVAGVVSWFLSNPALAGVMKKL